MAKPKLFNSIDEFRKAHGKDPAQAAPIADANVRGSFDTVVIKAEGDSRTITFTISTASVDRMGDTIRVDGWKLDAFRKNPVVLWAHDAGSLPVAKAPKVWVEDGKLKAEAEFTPAGMARFNDTVFEMYQQGFLSATSVGFNPLKYAFTDDPQRRYGIDFLEQELLEFSAVPVPANPEALIEGKAVGIDITPILDWCENAIRRAGDNERIIKLAEKMLGGNGQDLVALAWAERIVTAAGRIIAPKGHVVVPPERAAAIERLEKQVTQDRVRKKRMRELELLRMRG